MFLKILSLFRWQKLDAGTSDEMQDHAELLTEQNVATGHGLGLKDSPLVVSHTVVGSGWTHGAR